jgi:hypothetical protein
MDTATFWKKQHDWYMAARAGNAEAAERALASTGQLRDGLLTGVIRHAQFDGTGAAYARSAIEELVRNSATEAIRRGRARFAHDVMLNLGRPSYALRYLNMSRDSAKDLNVAIIRVRAAIMGEGEKNPEDAVKFLEALEARPDPADSAEREVAHAVVRVMEPWRLIHGDSSRTRRSLQRLRTLARLGPRTQVASTQLEIAYIEMLHAGLAKSRDLRAFTERADSMLMDQDFGTTHTGRTSQHALAIAHSWEQLGEPARALSAVLRYFTWNSEVMPYLGIQVREIARIAALAGDRPRAGRSYRHFLAMRSQAEPALKPRIDSVRAELAELESRR